MSTLRPAAVSDSAATAGPPNPAQPGCRKKGHLERVGTLGIGRARLDGREAEVRGSGDQGVGAVQLAGLQGLRVRQSVTGAAGTSALGQDLPDAQAGKDRGPGVRPALLPARLLPASPSPCKPGPSRPRLPSLRLGLAGPSCGASPCSSSASRPGSPRCRHRRRPGRSGDAGPSAGPRCAPGEGSGGRASLGGGRLAAHLTRFAQLTAAAPARADPTRSRSAANGRAGRPRPRPLPAARPRPLGPLAPRRPRA